MTQPRELDHLLTAFFAAGTDELADRVIDAALDQIDHSPQRHALGLPWRFPAMTMTTRLAAAAVIGVLAVGGALYLMKPSVPDVGSPSPTPANSVLPSTVAKTPNPTATPGPTALIGPIGEGRQIHTSTQLADGRVLVVGGYALGDGPLASATLYDPDTGIFSPTGSLADARGAHSATLLDNGRVLVAGGGIAGWAFTGSYLASAELFDSTTGTFSPTGSLATPRQAHTATKLSDGRVLFVGGADTQTHSLATAELYDPRTGLFTATGSMAASRAWHTATLLADGRVLITGGLPAAWSISTKLATAEIYDPKTGTFTPTGSMTTDRVWHTATLLSDGRVLIAGGANTSTEDLTSAEIYDPTTGTFSPTATMNVGREYHTATLLTDHRVLVTGGGGDYPNSGFFASAEIYDPKTGTFAPTGSMADARTNHAASLLPDGRILVSGGYGVDVPLASAEIFDPNTGTFSRAG